MYTWQYEEHEKPLVVTGFMNCVHCPNFINTVIPIVIRHRRNPLDSTHRKSGLEVKLACEMLFFFGGTQQSMQCSFGSTLFLLH
jgi:hypothetical protein